MERFSKNYSYRVNVKRDPMGFNFILFIGRSAIHDGEIEELITSISAEKGIETVKIEPQIYDPDLPVITIPDVLAEKLMFAFIDTIGYESFQVNSLKSELRLEKERTTKLMQIVSNLTGIS